MRQDIRRGRGKADYAERCQAITEFLDDHYSSQSKQRSKKKMRQLNNKINAETRRGTARQTLLVRFVFCFLWDSDFVRTQPHEGKTSNA